MNNFDNELNELLEEYEFGQKMLETELDILIKEFTKRRNYNPVEHIKSRIKSKKSIIRKLEKKNLEFTRKNIEENKDIIKEDLKERPVYIEKIFTFQEAENIANIVLTDEYINSGYFVIFDKEVSFEKYNYFREDMFYRFLIQNEQNAIEPAIYINKRTGVPIICYPDDSYSQVRKDLNFKPNSLIWYGDYFKTEWEWDNCYSRLSISTSELGDNYLYMSVDSYFGRGSYRMAFDAELVNENKAVYKCLNGDIIEFNLNENNTISTVVTGDEDLKLALSGDFK